MDIMHDVLNTKPKFDLNSTNNITRPLISFSPYPSNKNLIMVNLLKYPSSVGEIHYMSIFFVIVKISEM
jgi:hypothetical protein